MMLGIRSLVMYMEKHVLRKVNLLNESQYIKRLVSIVARRGYPSSLKNLKHICLSILA